MKKAYEKVVATHIVETVESETGELLDITTKQVKVIVKDKEEFFFLYSHILGLLSNIGKGPELAVLSVIMFRHLTSQGIFNVTKSVVADIATMCSIAEVTVTRAIKSLSEHKVLIKLSKGAYSLNANYAWKGTTSTRNEKLSFNLNITTEKSESFF